MKKEKTNHGEELTSLEKLAFRVAQNMGSATSLLIHTVFFIVIFSLRWFGFSVEQILLILTTLVSLEAIYMFIFIQMTVNRQAEGLTAVQENIEEISDDVDEIQEDIEDIQEDVKEISEDVEDISEDIDDISDEIVDEEGDRKFNGPMNQKLQKIEETLHKLLIDIENLKK